MKRLIYAFESAESARAHISRLRRHGVGDDHLALVARADIAMEKIPTHLADASMDVLPALARGAAFGGLAGLIAGFTAMAVPLLGIAIDGPGLVAFVVLGALIGTWSAGIVGASVPSKVQRRFQKEIEEGYILLVVDASDAEAKIVRKWMADSQPGQVWQGEVDPISK